MSTEISNRFNSAINSSYVGTNPSGTIIVPSGCYFVGQFTVFGIIESAVYSFGLRDASNNYACMLSPEVNTGAGGKGGNTQQIYLSAGTWTVVGNQANSTNNLTVSITGICFNI